MSGEDITNIIISFGLVGWIPIFFLFGGITKVVCAFKGDANKENSHMNSDITTEEGEEECKF